MRYERSPGPYYQIQTSHLYETPYVQCMWPTEAEVNVEGDYLPSPWPEEIVTEEQAQANPAWAEAIAQFKAGDYSAAIAAMRVVEIELTREAAGGGVVKRRRPLHLRSVSSKP
jgi:hypothetical protein